MYLNLANFFNIYLTNAIFGRFSPVFPHFHHPSFIWHHPPPIRACPHSTPNLHGMTASVRMKVHFPGACPHSGCKMQDSRCKMQDASVSAPLHPVIPSEAFEPNRGIWHRDSSTPPGLRPGSLGMTNFLCKMAKSPNCIIIIPFVIYSYVIYNLWYI